MASSATPAPVAASSKHVVTAPTPLPGEDSSGMVAAVACTPDELLTQLLEQHASIMYRVARSIVHDSALAEDVVQESLLKAWQAAGSFRGDSLRAWALRITHNTAISAMRKRRDDLYEPASLPETADGIGPERSVAGRMMADDLWKALGDLDETTRSIVVLREVEGLTYDEIGSVLDLALPTVKTRLFRARRSLAGALEAWQ
jgi:RNA polymerase sigma-70 factor, ECF subfamily